MIYFYIAIRYLQLCMHAQTSWQGYLGNELNYCLIYFKIDDVVYILEETSVLIVASGILKCTIDCDKVIFIVKRFMIFLLCHYFIFCWIENQKARNCWLLISLYFFKYIKFELTIMSVCVMLGRKSSSNTSQFRCYTLTGQCCSCKYYFDMSFLVLVKPSSNKYCFINILFQPVTV